MANNKVQLADGSVLIDLTDTTAVASDVAQGKYFYGANGVKMIGTAGTWGTEITIADSGVVVQSIDAGKIYHFTGNLTSLTITLGDAEDSLAHYHFDFLSGSTAPTLTMPNTVTMPDSFTVEANKRYEVDVLNNYGAVISWANS